MFADTLQFSAATSLALSLTCSDRVSVQAEYEKPPVYAHESVPTTGARARSCPTAPMHGSVFLDGSTPNSNGARLYSVNETAAFVASLQVIVTDSQCECVIAEAVGDAPTIVAETPSGIAHAYERRGRTANCRHILPVTSVDPGPYLFANDAKYALHFGR